jgi:pilus assembly protein CpaB
MKTRGLALAIALLVAASATAAVFLYVQNVKADATAGAAMVTVVVSKKDITAGTKLDPLVDSGQLTTLQVPQAAVVPGAVTDLSQLRGRRANTFILQGEQISTARLQGTSYNTGGALGLPKGYEGISIQLQAQAVPGQLVQPGDHVAVYATFSDVDFKGLGDVTVNLVPDAQVLRVSGGGGTTETASTNDIMVTLGLTPRNGQRVVFAQEKGSVWLALLPPGLKGKPLPPVNYAQAFTHPGAPNLGGQ